MNERLLDINEETDVRVVDIEDDPEVRSTLGYLGIAEGTRLRVLQKPSSEKIIPGPLEISVNNKKGIIGQGMGQMIVLEKNGSKIRLHELSKGEKGTVVEIQGGEDAKDTLWNLSIEVGAQIEMLRHFSDDVIVLDVAGETMEIGEGKAAKVWVRTGGELLQLNYLKKGQVATVVRIDGGELTKKDFKELDLSEGKELKLNKRMKKSITTANVDKAVFVEVEGKETRIGHGLAEKVWVEEN